MGCQLYSNFWIIRDHVFRKATRYKYEVCGSTMQITSRTLSSYFVLRLHTGKGNVTCHWCDIRLLQVCVFYLRNKVWLSYDVAPRECLIRIQATAMQITPTATQTRDQTCISHLLSYCTYWETPRQFKKFMYESWACAPATLLFVLSNETCSNLNYRTQDRTKCAVVPSDLLAICNSLTAWLSISLTSNVCSELGLYLLTPTIISFLE